MEPIQQSSELRDMSVEIDESSLQLEKSETPPISSPIENLYHADGEQALSCKEKIQQQIGVMELLEFVAAGGCCVLCVTFTCGIAFSSAFLLGATATSVKAQGIPVVIGTTTGATITGCSSIVCFLKFLKDTVGSTVCGVFDSKKYKNLAQEQQELVERTNQLFLGEVGEGIRELENLQGQENEIAEGGQIVLDDLKTVLTEVYRRKKNTELDLQNLLNAYNSLVGQLHSYGKHMLDLTNSYKAALQQNNDSWGQYSSQFEDNQQLLRRSVAQMKEQYTKRNKENLKELAQGKQVQEKLQALEDCKKAIEDLRFEFGQEFQKLQENVELIDRTAKNLGVGIKGLQLSTAELEKILPTVDAICKKRSIDDFTQDMNILKSIGLFSKQGRQMIQQWQTYAESLVKIPGMSFQCGIQVMEKVGPAVHNWSSQIPESSEQVSASIGGLVEKFGELQISVQEKIPFNKFIGDIQSGFSSFFEKQKDE